jgi:hypothetical protein
MSVTDVPDAATTTAIRCFEAFNTNSTRATPNGHGTYTLTFNGEGESVNPLDVAENWNSLLRCYLPTSAEGILELEKTSQPTTRFCR